MSAISEKKCSACHVIKPVTEFYKRKDSKDGYRGRCASCMDLEVVNWISRNGDARKNIANKYARKNPEVLKRNTRAWVSRNPEANKEMRRAYYRERPEIYGSAKVMKRVAQKLKATPKWANQEAIKRIYADAVSASVLTGVKHHVDHAVPLRSPKVCGLHCESNLVVMPGSENLTKSNRRWPDMP